MPEQISNLLIITGALCLLILFWVLSIVLVYWDITRRQVGGLELGAWVALVALLPLIGLLAYMFYRLLGLVISPARRKKQGKKKRETLLKPDASGRRISTTVPAIDYSKNPSTGLKPSGTPLTEPYRVMPESGDSFQRPIAVRLVIAEGPHKGREYALPQLPAVIGRGPEVAISLDEDRGVSRQHAEIYENAGVVRISDLKSTHGTQVNGFGIGDKALDSGDRIQIGKTVLVVAIEGSNDEG